LREGDSENELDTIACRLTLLYRAATGVLLVVDNWPLAHILYALAKSLQERLSECIGCD